jgi:hypothetical protein
MGGCAEIAGSAERLKKEYRGLEFDPGSGCRDIAAVAALDGSVGWNAMISGACSFLSGRLPEEASRTVVTP